MSKQEEWRSVKGHEGFYEVSNKGNVRSLVNRYKTRGMFNLKLGVNNKGYLHVDLAKPELRRHLVHRLVATAFLIKPLDCNVVNHIDNNPQNNNVENLNWTTTSGNLQHAQDQGRLFDAQSKGGKVQSTKEQARVAEELQATLGTAFGKLTVVSLAEPTVYGPAIRHRFNCACSCGNHVEVDRFCLANGTITQCRPCSSNQKAQLFIVPLLEKLTNTTAGKYFITGNSNNCYGIITKTLRLEVIDSVTGETSYKSYKHLLSLINSI